MLKESLHLNIAACHLITKNWQLVVRQCSEALALNPRSVKAFYRRAIAYENMKELNFALEDVKKCHDLDNNDPKVIELLQRLEVNQIIPYAKKSDFAYIPSTHTQIDFPQLELGRIHERKYVLGIIASDGMVMNGLHFTMRWDKEFETVLVSVYNFEGYTGKFKIVKSKSKSPEECFKLDVAKRLGYSLGRRICILNPFYKVAMDGQHVIRIDDPSVTVIFAS